MASDVFRVRALEWKDSGDGWLIAATMFGEIVVRPSYRGDELVAFVVQLRGNNERHPTVDAAKARAEQWYRDRLAPALEVVEERNSTMGSELETEVLKAQCFDCKRPYGDANGFPDLVIDNAAWRTISPDGEGNGLLCPSCICKRLVVFGIECEGRFTSGPISLVSVTIAERDREWVEAIHPGGANTHIGQVFNTPTKHRQLSLAQFELEAELNEDRQLLLIRLNKKRTDVVYYHKRVAELIAENSDQAVQLAKLNRVVEAARTVKALPTKESRLRREYPPGTCNAEDAWRDFNKECSAAHAELDAALAALKEPQT